MGIAQVGHAKSNKKGPKRSAHSQPKVNENISAEEVGLKSQPNDNRGVDIRGNVSGVLTTQTMQKPCRYGRQTHGRSLEIRPCCSLVTRVSLSRSTNEMEEVEIFRETADIAVAFVARRSRLGTRRGPIPNELQT
ncbi:hypothetical protein CRG98_044520 [Punica granatum]|uniref:Uncharacterized protein n=1 Tax=Punica granatum TaxID=22663 RepID=A0A2I0HUB1_PUNGR|nr:hypothetical protein CRG98_044520 [Punica granatum]